LGSIDGARVLTPHEPDRSAALVTFTIDGLKGEEASRLLRVEHNIRIKHVSKIENGLRASIAFFTLEAEIDALLRGVGELATRATRLG
jgi:selenocysteine lyase/cysteine desulfurase